MATYVASAPAGGNMKITDGSNTFVFKTAAHAASLRNGEIYIPNNIGFPEITALGDWSTPDGSTLTAAQVVDALNTSFFLTKPEGPAANTLHVSGVRGNDTTGTKGDASKPFLTIQAAIDAASSGDIIYLHDSVFDERPIWISGLQVILSPSAGINYTGSGYGS